MKSLGSITTIAGGHMLDAKANGFVSRQTFSGLNTRIAFKVSISPSEVRLSSI